MTATEDEYPSESSAVPAAASPPKNPAQKVLGSLGNLASNSKLGSSTSEMSLKDYVKHVSLWTEPLLTIKYLVFFVTLWHFTRCNDANDPESDLPNYSYVSFFAWILLARVLVVSLPQIAAKHLMTNFENDLVKKVADLLDKAGKFIAVHTAMPKDKDVDYWISGVGDFLESKIKEASKMVVKAESDERILKVVLFNIGAVMVVFWLVSLRTLFFGTVFGLLTLPVVYKRFHVEIDKGLEIGQSKVKPFVDKAELKGKEIGEVIGKKVSQGLGTAKGKYEEFRKMSTEKAKAALNKKA